jgi:hypothetical protein
LCGGPGEEVDHIAGPSTELTNLRLLCRSCHRVVTEQHLIPITDAEHEALFQQIWFRSMSPMPLRPCDTEEWRTTWRAWTKSAGRHHP